MDGTERSTRSWHGTGEASSTPELTATSTPAQTFESDWHQFGGLLAQVFSGVGQDIATNPAKQGQVVAKVRDAQRITGVKVIFSRECSIGHLTDDLAERKFSPTPTLRHLACKGLVYPAPQDARHAA